MPATTSDEEAWQTLDEFWLPESFPCIRPPVKSSSASKSPPQPEENKHPLPLPLPLPVIPKAKPLSKPEPKQKKHLLPGASKTPNRTEKENSE